MNLKDKQPEKFRYVFLTYGDVALSVFSSQVLTPMKKLQDQGIHHDLIGFCTVGERFNSEFKRNLINVKREFNGQFEVCTTLPWVGRFDLRNAVSKTKQALKRLGINQEESIIIHSRGHYASYIALSLKRFYPKMHVIANLRGLAAPEYSLYIKPSIPFYRLDWRLITSLLVKQLHSWEKQIAQNADKTICVSNAFKEFLVEQYSVNMDRVHVITTAVDTELFKLDKDQRDEIRRSLDINSKFALVFCGSMHEWELTPKTLSLLSKFLATYTDSHFLLLTTCPEKAWKAINKYRFPKSSVTIKSVPHKEVASYLMAADAGLMIRDSNIVNQVAAPTKFAEYLACGLPVIVSNRVGDMADVVVEKNVGWIIDDGEEGFSKMQNIYQQWKAGMLECHFKENCCRAAKELYSWETQMDGLISVYESASLFGQG